MSETYVRVRRVAVAAVALAGAGLGATAQGASVGLDWGTTAVGSTETAGVVPMQNWTNLATTVGATGGGPLALHADDGTSAGTVTWVGGQSTNHSGVSNTAGNGRMMFGYLDTPGNNTQNTVTVAGLPTSIANSPYAVIVYYDTNNTTTSGDDRVGRYTLSGVTTGAATLYGRDATGANFSGTFVQGQTTTTPAAAAGTNFSSAASSVPAGNYLMFTNVTGTDFTLTATPYVASGNNIRAAINGIQIVPMSAVPEPGSAAAVGLAGSGLLLRRRARRRA